MPDQETQDFYNEESVVEEQEEQQVETAPAVVEPVAPVNQALIAERQAAQQEVRQLREELHALRTATLQQASAPQQNVDPVGNALKRIEKDMDPDAFKFTAPGTKLILEELHAMRLREDALMQRNQYLEQTVSEIAQEARSRKVYSQLSQAIPDLDKLGPIMIEHLGKQSVEMQQKYINDPSLLIPLAEAFRAAGVKPGKNVQAERAKVGMDLGAGERATPITASDVERMKPGSAEFEKHREAFWNS